MYVNKSGCMTGLTTCVLECLQVVVVPGRIFHVRGRDPAFKCPFVRLAFCNVSDENLREGARRFGQVLRNVAHSGKSDCKGMPKADMPLHGGDRQNGKVAHTNGDVGATQLSDDTAVAEFA